MLIYQGSIKSLALAVQHANNTVKDIEKLRKIINRETYDFSTAGRETLIKIMFDFCAQNTVVVKTYYKRSWFGLKRSPTLAYCNDQKFMHINSANLDRSVSSIFGTVMHELGHNADYWCTTETMGHGDNSSIGKDNTFTYHLGNEAKKALEKGEI
jgi:Zn-dependent peptidase ImmA (M78 family)